MPAHKGNKYAAGNKGGGREPMYKSSAAMQDKIDEYFGKEKTPTIPGLAYYLGFSSRQSLLEYEVKEEFNFPIKRAKLKIEEFNAKQLHLKEGSVTGVIFTLKNLGWKDQSDLDLNVDLGNLSEEALLVISNNIIKKQNDE